MKNAEAIADKIVEELFHNGANEEAARLVLELPNKRDGGGWCKDAVRSAVLKVLKEGRL